MYEERALFGGSCVGRVDSDGGAGYAGASCGEDGVVAEHRDEHDDGNTDSSGGCGEVASNGEAGAGVGSDNDGDAVLPDAGEVAEVVCEYAAEQRLSVYECSPELDRDVR